MTMLAHRVVVVASIGCALAFGQDAAAAQKNCPSQGSQCTIYLKLVNGKPFVADEPIVVLQGKHDVHINWRAPRGWEFADGGVALKSSTGAAEFDQWCATDVDNDNCATRKAKGGRYHCRALNRTPGTHEYRLKLRKIGTNVEHEIDPTIINKG
jgi:hypothetical protein